MHAKELTCPLMVCMRLRYSFTDAASRSYSPLAMLAHSLIVRPQTLSLGEQPGTCKRNTGQR